MSRKPLTVIIALFAVCALVVTACGGDDATATPAPTNSPSSTARPTTATTALPTVTPTSAPTPTSTVNPKLGGTLTAAQILNPFCFDPIINCIVGSVSANRGFFNKLIRTSQADGATAIPDLSTSWSVSGDGLTYTFKLRQGVKFHDGSDFAAKDVLFAVDRIKNQEKYEAQGLPPTRRSPLAKAQWGVVTKVEAPDPSTVVFTLARYSNTWFASLLEPNQTLFIVPSAVAPAQILRTPIGTGPFKFDAFQDNVSVKGVKSATYWKKDKTGNQLPFLDGYEIFIITDTNTLLANFRTGRVLWSRPLNANRVVGQEERLRAEISGMQSAPLASTLHTVLTNNRLPALQDIRVRQAIDLALNRWKINKAAFSNAGIVRHGVMIPKELNGVWALPQTLFDNRPGYKQDPNRTADVERAKQLMQEVGFGPNKPLELRAVVAQSSGDIMVAVLDSLKDIYITTTSEGIVVVTGNDFPELMKKNWDVGIYFAGSGSDFPGFNFRQNFSSVMNDTGYFMREFDFIDVDALWNQFDAERDVARQHAIVDQIQEKFLEKLYLIPIYRSAVFHAWWPAVRNMPRTQCCTVGDIVEDFEAVWIDRDFRPIGSATTSDTPFY